MPHLMMPTSPQTRSNHQGATDAAPGSRAIPAFARSRRRAFTIVEVLVAMGILAIGIASVFTLLPVAALIQKQAVDASQGPEFGNSVLAILKATATRTDPCFSVGNDPSVVQSRFKALESNIQDQRYSFNNNLSQLYNYQMVYRRLVANGPVEVAILIYRRLPEEEQNVANTALKSIVTPYYGTTSLYGSTETIAANRGLMKTGAIGVDQAINGNLFLVGNADSTYYITKYAGTNSDATYGYRVSPIPVDTCEDVIALKKSPVTATGTLTCIAIVTGVIQ
jgi:prepilin-type N-terminal cleavage/methylation domain-containing protein